MPTCEYSDVCGRDALDGHDGKCILHSEDPEKDEEAFEDTLEQHREEHEGDFRGMVFPMEVDFSDTSFEDTVDFCRATFRKGARFRDTSFKDGANFQYVLFAEGVNDFLRVSFEGKAGFRDATSKSPVDFSEASFGGEADFRHASFGAWIGFRYATFGDGVDFHDCSFERGADFQANSFEGKANFRLANFGNRTVFSRSDETQFGEADFSACKVRGKVLFAGESEGSPIFADGDISFTSLMLSQDAALEFRYADLSQCRFLRTDLRDIEFTGVKWSDEASGGELFNRMGLYEEIAEESVRGNQWADKNPGENEKQRPWPEIERLYRELKTNYEEKGDFPRAGDFHIGEKEARRRNPNTNLLMKALLWTYRALSKYGERALPATLWLVVLVFGFALLYYLSGATTLATVGAVTYSEAFIHSLEATFYPVRSVGFLSFWPQFFSITQRGISPILIALLVLALRQRVKR